MEEQDVLNKGIGTIEQKKETLSPEEVKIVGVKIEDTPKAKKVVFLVKHSGKEEPIKISSVAQIVNKTIKCVGTWLNEDEEGNIQKGSALANFLNYLGSSTILDAVGKDVHTELNGDFLCFKGY